MAPRNRNNPKRSGSSEGTYTRADLERDFPDDQTCLTYLWRQNHSDDGEHAHCPKCREVRKFHRVKSRPSYSCDACGHHIHPTAGTIFHKSSTGLDLWFKGIFLMASTRCGMSAKQLERELGVTYKTAWRMANLIRKKLMDQDDESLAGEVEMDETYVGGKPRGREIHAMRRTGLGAMQAGQAASRAKKTTVFGMVERGGKVVAHVVGPQFQDAAFRHIGERVLPRSVVYTDEAAAYQPLESRGYEHRRIHHATKVYVDGDVHTNTIEGFWALVKNGLRGTYHAVSAKHLQGYLNEFAWRYNQRKHGEPMFLTLLRRAALAS
jgi:transposase